MKKTTEKIIQRRITKIIEKDLEKKMVLLSGPRQSGKTSLAKGLLETDQAYYNWDIPKDRIHLKSQKFKVDASLWIFDEIHKYRSWRNWLKGVYDNYADDQAILVTGSAKLDVYSRGGDSLQGRYFRHRLHPLTLSEVTNSSFQTSDEIPMLSNTFQKSHQSSYLDLFKLGGFPEPFTSQSEQESNRWRLGYGMRLVKEEIQSLEKLIDLDKVEILYDQLTSCVGSPLSINSLREDLEVAYGTAKNWLQIFDNIYATFRIPPFGTSKIKAVKKEQKLYFWDWAKVPDESYRAENMVAMHLLRLCHWIEDVEGSKCELRYYRSTIPQEVDFVLLKNKKPWMAIEVKTSEESLHPALKYLLERVDIPYAFQLHHKGENHWTSPKIGRTKVHFMPISYFLNQLP